MTQPARSHTVGDPLLFVVSHLPRSATQLRSCVRSLSPTFHSHSSTSRYPCNYTARISAFVHEPNNCLDLQMHDTSTFLSPLPVAQVREVSVWILDKKPLSGGGVGGSKATNAKAFEPLFEQQRKGCSHMTRVRGVRADALGATIWCETIWCESYKCFY